VLAGAGRAVRCCAAAKGAGAAEDAEGVRWDWVKFEGSVLQGCIHSKIFMKSFEFFLKEGTNGLFEGPYQSSSLIQA